MLCEDNVNVGRRGKGAGTSHLTRLGVHSPSVRLVGFNTVNLGTVVFSPLLVTTSAKDRCNAGVAVGSNSEVAKSATSPSKGLCNMVAPTKGAPNGVGLNGSIAIGIGSTSKCSGKVVVRNGGDSLATGQLAMSIINRASTVNVGLVNSCARTSLNANDAVGDGSSNVVVKRDSALATARFAVRGSGNVNLAVGSCNADISLKDKDGVAASKDANICVNNLGNGGTGNTTHFATASLAVSIRNCDTVKVGMRGGSIISLKAGDAVGAGNSGTRNL